MNHLLKAGLACTLLLGTASAIQAQTTISFGPRLGGNLTKLSYNNSPQGLSDIKYQFGVQAGVALNVDFGNNLAFQPALLFSQKGAELQGTETESQGGFVTNVSAKIKPRLDYLELPLNVVYTTGGDHGFQLFLGPYVALGIGGGGSYEVTLNSADPALASYNGTYPGSLEVVYGNTDQTNNTTNNSNALATPALQYPVRQFDAGLNGGVGYRIGPVQAQLGYSLGLANIVPNDSNGNDTGDRARNRGFQLAATYFFTADSFRKK